MMRGGVGLEGMVQVGADRRDDPAMMLEAIGWLNGLLSLSASLQQCRKPEGAIEIMLGEGLRALEARAMSVVTLSASGAQLNLVGAVGYPTDALERLAVFPVATALPITDAVRTGVPVYLGSREERTLRYPHIATNPDLINDRAWAAIPYKVWGRIAGGLAFAFAESQRFETIQRAFLTTLADLYRLALERAPAYETSDLIHTFLKDVLLLLTGGRLLLCGSVMDLPNPLQTLWMGNVGPILLKTDMDVRALRDLARQAALACGLAYKDAEGLAAAASEGAANALIHGQGGEGVVCIGKGAVQIWVRDQGKGMVESALPRAAVEPGYSTIGRLGLGMKMMLAMADRVFLLTGGEGTTVVIEKARSNRRV